MYDRTVGAPVPIGSALTMTGVLVPRVISYDFYWLFESQSSTNEIIVKIWDTHTDTQTDRYTRAFVELLRN